VRVNPQSEEVAEEVEAAEVEMAGAGEVLGDELRDMVATPSRD
jgi:hypothetical protein